MKRSGMCLWFDTICSPFAWAHGSQITHHERGNRRLLIGLCCFWMLCINGDLSAASVDGTSSTQYKSTTQIFRTGMDDYVRGFARLGNGFAVASRASAFMDTNISVSGQMDLGETGMLVLLNNLYFERNITLTSGGNIKGKATVSGDAKTIFLGGDMTLSATTYARVLHITGDWSNSGTSGDLIIDGRGHTLDIQDRAQIFVDTNVTLTLRNMTIRTGVKSLNVPAIRLAAQGSKLTLDNVIFDLGADFQFKQGQMFIHDSVAMTGTSAFIYQSPRPSYITSGATLSFEYGTTFSVAPATASDVFYNGIAPYVSNNFIVLADSSSALYLNSCTLKTTYTGLRLTKGLVMFDNRVAVDTVAGVDFATTTPIAFLVSASMTQYPCSTEWSPDGRFFAVSDSNVNNMRVYRFNGSSAPLLLGTVTTGNGPYSLAWSPDGCFLAVANGISFQLWVYRFNGSSTPTFLGMVSTGASVTSEVAWSPDGRFLAVAIRGANSVQVYRFNGSSAPTLLGTVVTGASPYTAQWSPDGRFLAVVNSSDNTMGVYRFNGKNTPSLLGAVGTGNWPRSVAWSPDGCFLAVVNFDGNTMEVYRFDGKSIPSSLGTVGLGGYPTSVRWSPDGRFLAVVTSSANTVRVYRFYANSAPSLLGTVGTPISPLSVSWSPDGQFLAVPLYGSSAVWILSCNYIYSGQPAQGFTNGLVFGDSVKGSAYNVNVRVLPGCSMALQGKMTDDSV